jgi:5-methylcytosine-specific restriction endonuclease McrA
MKRREAKAIGLIRYDGGRTCPSGHTGERFVSTGMCCKCLLDYTKLWRTGVGKDRVNEIKQAWRKKYPAKYAEEERLYRKKNKNKRSIYLSIYSKGRPLENRLASARRTALKRSAGGTHTASQIRALWEKQKYKCPYCKVSIRKKYHIDHVIALAIGGTNGIDNIQLLCPTCNMRKHTKDHFTFARQHGLLI